MLFKRNFITSGSRALQSSANKGITGATLYIHFVDGLGRPGLLWFIFSMIGVATIIGLLLFNKFLKPEHNQG